MNLNSNNVEQENWPDWQRVFMPNLFYDSVVSGALCALHNDPAQGGSDVPQQKRRGGE